VVWHKPDIFKHPFTRWITQLQIKNKMVKELKIEWNVPKHTALFTICMSLGIL